MTGAGVGQASLSDSNACRELGPRGTTLAGGWRSSFRRAATSWPTVAAVRWSVGRFQPAW